jgi:hypothetical protein
MGTAYKLWLEISEKRPLENPACKQNTNVNMDVKEIECEGVHWIELIQDMSFAIFCKLGNDLRVPLGMENFFSRPSTLKFWRNAMFRGIVYFLEYRLIYFYYSPNPDEI